MERSGILLYENQLSFVELPFTGTKSEAAVQSSIGTVAQLGSREKNYQQMQVMEKLLLTQQKRNLSYPPWGNSSKEGTTYPPLILPEVAHPTEEHLQGRDHTPSSQNHTPPLTPPEVVHGLGRLRGLERTVSLWGRR